MTKKVFESRKSELSVTVSGDYPTHSVLGTPVDFYVYVKDNWEPWSKWIKGNSKLYFELKKIHDNKDLELFVSMIESTWNQHKK